MCLGAAPAAPTITEHCPETADRASVRGVGGSDAVLAARLLPHAGAALPEPVDVRLVLTGPGGGTWDVTMGSPPAAASVAIVTDAVGFCRLAANRVTPADLNVSVTGDPVRAAAVLAAAATLALD